MATLFNPNLKFEKNLHFFFIFDFLQTFLLFHSNLPAFSHITSSILLKISQCPPFSFLDPLRNTMETDWDEYRFLQVIKFGLNKLKKPEITLTKDQLDAIRSFAQGKNVFVSLPTGSGKSIIFHIMPFIFEFLSLSGDDERNFIFIVQPLLGLIDDQIRAGSCWSSLLDDSTAK